MTNEQILNQKKGYLEYLRISYSIGKIKNDKQFRSTYKWITLFDDRHKIADLTASLRQEMLNLEL